MSSKASLLPATRASAVLLLIQVVALSCVKSTPWAVEGEAHPRDGLFATAPGDRAHSVSRALMSQHRMTVVFHPLTGYCVPQEDGILRAIRRVGTEFDDVEIITVLPPEAAGLPRYEDLPGRTLIQLQSVTRTEERISPRPRLELWSGKTLLLLKSLPGTATEDMVFQDILWARAFTRPTEQVASR